MHMFWSIVWPSSGRWRTEDILQKHQEKMHKYKIVRFKMYGIKPILKYKIQIDYSYAFVGFSSISNHLQYTVMDYLTKRGKVCSLHLQELKRRQAVENPCREVLYFVSVENPATQRTSVCKDTGHCCTLQESVRTQDIAGQCNTL